MHEQGVGDWWFGIPAVTSAVDCGGVQHSLTWRDGELIVEDHDVTGERALAAMGGTLPYCVAVLDAWRATGPDPYVLSQWDGHRITSTVQSAGLKMLASQGHGASGAERWLELQRRRDILASLPAPLYDRLALGIAAALCNGERHPGLGGMRRWRVDDLTPHVAARAVPLLHDSIGSWRGAADPWTAPVVDCRIADPDEGASVDGLVERRGGWVDAALGPAWLVEVWGRGLALVDGCFVITATTGAAVADPVDAVAVRWERVAAGGLEPVTGPARLTPGRPGWRLRWT